MKARIRLRGCAGWSGPSLSAFARRHVFSWRGLYDVLVFVGRNLIYWSLIWFIRVVSLNWRNGMIFDIRNFNWWIINAFETCSFIRYKWTPFSNIDTALVFVNLTVRLYMLSNKVCFILTCRLPNSYKMLKLYKNYRRGLHLPKIFKPAPPSRKHAYIILTPLTLTFM